MTLFENSQRIFSQSQGLYQFKENLLSDHKQWSVGVVLFLSSACEFYLFKRTFQSRKKDISAGSSIS